MVSLNYEMQGNTSGMGTKKELSGKHEGSQHLKLAKRKKG